jgi:hypothetical protein
MIHYKSQAQIERERKTEQVIIEKLLKALELSGTGWELPKQNWGDKDYFLPNRSWGLDGGLFMTRIYPKKLKIWGEGDLVYCVANLALSDPRETWAAELKKLQEAVTVRQVAIKERKARENNGLDARVEKVVNGLPEGKFKRDGEFIVTATESWKGPQVKLIYKGVNLKFSDISEELANKLLKVWNDEQK